jgi:hypothetical protein
MKGMETRRAEFRHGPPERRARKSHGLAAINMALLAEGLLSRYFFFWLEIWHMLTGSVEGGNQISSTLSIALTDYTKRPTLTNLERSE